MKPFCLILLAVFVLSGCSTFSKSTRTERAYQKYIQNAKAARDKQRKRIIQQQQKQGRTPSLRDSPPVEQQTTEPAPENQ